jgi:hypothetical protein
MFGKKHVKAFKCMLALSQTDVRLLPLVKVHDNKIYVPSTIIAKLWVASINLFGYTKPGETLDTVFLNTTEILGPTTAWIACNTSIIDGFTKETLFAEGDDGAHDFTPIHQDLLPKNRPWTKPLERTLSATTEKNGVEREGKQSNEAGNETGQNKSKNYLRMERGRAS